MPGVFGGGGGETEVVNEPWGPARDNMKDILDQSEWQYYNYRPEFYPHSTVAPMSGYSQDAINYMAGRAMAGSPLLRTGQQSIYDIAGGAYMGGGPAGRLFEYAAGGGMQNPALGLLSDTATGQYLNANPYIDAAFGNAAESIADQFLDATQGTNAYFNMMGGTSGGGFAEARNELDETLAEQLGDLSQDYYYRNYADERNKQLMAQNQMGGLYESGFDRALGAGRMLEDIYARDIDTMMRGAMAAPGMAQQDYYDIEQLARAGGAMDFQRQQEIDDAVRRWDYYQTGAGSPYGLLDRYAGYTYPAAGYGSSQTTPYHTDTFGNLLSAGLAVGGLLI